MSLIPFLSKRNIIGSRDRKAALAVLLPLIVDEAQRGILHHAGEGRGISYQLRNIGRFTVIGIAISGFGFSVRVDRGRERLFSGYASPPHVMTWRRGWEREFYDATRGAHG
jgi:hypothetical protein